MDPNENRVINMKQKGIFFAILAAALYALNSPCSKLLLNEIPSTMLAGLLYLGAGSGLLIVGLISGKFRTSKKDSEEHLSKTDAPYVIGMVVLDIAAPICLLYGLGRTSAANAALLNNFEIVVTSIIALCIFKEVITKRLWTAIGLVTLASLLLSYEDLSSIEFSYGSLFILAACICWGFENNCTRKISNKSPLEIVIIKGFCSGSGSLIIAFFTGERVSVGYSIFIALLLGFAAYGLSIYFYIYAQRFLGASRTSTFYAFAPFIGAGLSIAIFKEKLSVIFCIAAVLMFLGAFMAARD